MSRHPHQPDDTDKETGFLTRWSRRKAQTESGESEPEADPVQPDADSQETQEPVKRDEDMPPLDTIDADSDVSEFFSPGVSETLRKAALRKLFHSPAFNIVDGLDDYDDDFTTFKALGDIITADMRHQMELEEEREKARKMDTSEDSALHEDKEIEETDVSSVSDEESENVSEPEDQAPHDQDHVDPSSTDESDQKDNQKDSKDKHTA